jgi:hypothetical protein
MWVGWVIPGEFGDTRVKVPGEAQVQVWSIHPKIYNKKFTKLCNNARIIETRYNSNNTKNLNSKI